MAKNFLGCSSLKIIKKKVFEANQSFRFLNHKYFLENIMPRLRIFLHSGLRFQDVEVYCQIFCVC